MTDKERELALYCLKASSDYHLEVCEECVNYPCDHTQQDDITETIIKALEQEPCEDAVSRKAVDHLCFEFLRVNSDNNIAFYEHFRDLPSVTPKPKKGHWIMTGDYYTGAYGSIDYVKCSCCGEDSLEEGNYCPNCGAEMESGDKE